MGIMMMMLTSDDKEGKIIVGLIVVEDASAMP
jgi:hypothetical protein